MLDDDRAKTRGGRAPLVRGKGAFSSFQSAKERARFLSREFSDCVGRTSFPARSWRDAGRLAERRRTLAGGAVVVGRVERARGLAQRLDFVHHHELETLRRLGRSGVALVAHKEHRGRATLRRARTAHRLACKPTQHLSSNPSSNTATCSLSLSLDQAWWRKEENLARKTKGRETRDPAERRIYTLLRVRLSCRPPQKKKSAQPHTLVSDSSVARYRTPRGRSSAQRTGARPPVCSAPARSRRPSRRSASSRAPASPLPLASQDVPRPHPRPTHAR